MHASLPPSPRLGGRPYPVPRDRRRCRYHAPLAGRLAATGRLRGQRPATALPAGASSGALLLVRGPAHQTASPRPLPRLGREVLLRGPPQARAADRLPVV